MKGSISHPGFKLGELLAVVAILVVIALSVAAFLYRPGPPEPLLSDWRRRVHERDEQSLHLAAELADQLAQIDASINGRPREWFNAWYGHNAPINPQVDQIVSTVRPNLKRLDALLGRGRPQWTTDEHLLIARPFMVHTTDVANLLLLHSVRQWSIGNRAEAEKAIALTLRLSHSLYPRADLLQALVANLLELKALVAIERTLLRERMLSDEDQTFAQAARPTPGC